MTEEIEQMRNDIVTYNNEIKEKEIETKEVISYYQLSQQENLYLEYAFGAEPQMWGNMKEPTYM